jgi:hypothetical protein
VVGKQAAADKPAVAGTQVAEDTPAAEDKLVAEVVVPAILAWCRSYRKTCHRNLLYCRTWDTHMSVAFKSLPTIIHKYTLLRYKVLTIFTK